MTQPTYFPCDYLFPSRLKENMTELLDGCVERVHSTYALCISYLVDPAESQPLPEIKLDLWDPSIRENALRILNVTEEDILQPGRLFQIYEKLILKLEDKQRRVPPIFARAYGHIIVNVKSAYLTLGRKE